MYMRMYMCTILMKQRWLIVQLKISIRCDATSLNVGSLWFIYSTPPFKIHPTAMKLVFDRKNLVWLSWKTIHHLNIKYNFGVQTNLCYMMCYRCAIWPRKTVWAGFSVIGLKVIVGVSSTDDLMWILIFSASTVALIIELSVQWSSCDILWI